MEDHSKESGLSIGRSGSRDRSRRDARRPRRRGDQDRGARQGRPGPRDRRGRGQRDRQRGGRNFYFEANNRHKKSIALDLKRPEAREIVHRLAAKSDVFVQNFRKGVATAARARLCRPARAQSANHLCERVRLRPRGARQRRAVVRLPRAGALRHHVRRRKRDHGADLHLRRHRRSDGRDHARLRSAGGVVRARAYGSGRRWMRRISAR